ncbi:MAG: MFS transporter [Acidimicrobiales bacterium]
MRTVTSKSQVRSAAVDTGNEASRATRVAGPVRAAERLDRLPDSRWLRTVMVVLFLSWLAESYDIGLIGSVLPSLSHLYHLSTGSKSLVATASTIGIVIGIAPAGWLADRYGRKRVLIGGTAGYAVLTFVTAFAGTVDELVALRLAAGIAMGAVFPLPYAYGAELCPPSIRGRFTGMADSFLSVGYFLSPLLAMLLIPSVANTFGWRVMFGLGGIPLLFAVVAWKMLPESPRWLESKGKLGEAEKVLSSIEARVRNQIGRPLPEPELAASSVIAASSAVGFGPSGTDPERKFTTPLREVFSRRFLRRSAVLWVTFGGTFFIFYSIQTFMPTVVTSMGFTLTSAFAFTAVIVGVSIPGKLLEAWLVERLGRKAVIVGFGLIAAVAALVFGLVRGGVAVLAVGGVMSFFGIGLDPAVKVYTAESYPTQIRGVATGATEGFGRLLSGIVGPAFIPPLLAVGGVAAAYSVVGVVALVAVATVAFLGEETSGRRLEDISDIKVLPRPSLLPDASRPLAA